MKQIAKYLNESATLEIEILGYADSNESSDDLAMKRSLNAYHFLLSLGVKKEKMKITVAESGNVIAPLGSMENRRVEFKILRWDHCLDEYYKSPR